MRGGVGVLAAGVALVAFAGVVTASAAPIVSAGLDQNVVLGDTVYLDGGGTHVPDGDLDGLEWSIETPDGRTIEPDCVDCERTSFQPTETGQYDVTLTAWGESGVERSDTLYVTVHMTSAVTDDPAVENESDNADGENNDRCFIATEGNDDEAMNDRICNYVGGVVDSERSEDGDAIEFYIVESGDLVSEFSGAEYLGNGEWKVPPYSLHHESDEIWKEHNEEKESLNLDGTNSRDISDGGSNYDPLEDNSATDGNDSGSSSDNAGGDYTLPPNYP